MIYMNTNARLPYNKLLEDVRDWLDIYNHALSPFKSFDRTVLYGRVVGHGFMANEPLSHDAARAVQEVFKTDEILQQFAQNLGLDYNNLDKLAKAEEGFRVFYVTYRITISAFEEMTKLASQTSGTLSTALLLHLHAEVRDSGLMSEERHQEGLNLEYLLLQEVAKERGYGDISYETLRRFSPVGKKAIYTNLSEPEKWGLGTPEDLIAKIGFDKQSDFIPIPILPIPPATTEEEGIAKKFFDDLVKEEPQYGFNLPELKGKSPHLVYYREDDWVPY